MNARLAAAALAAVLSAAPASAEEPTTTLRFAIPGSPTWSMLWEPWIAEVVKESGGALELQPFLGGRAEAARVRGEK